MLLTSDYVLAALFIDQILLVIIMRACVCQSIQLTLIGNKFMFFQHGHLLHVSIGVPDPCFDLCPDQ